MNWGIGIEHEVMIKYKDTMEVDGEIIIDNLHQETYGIENDIKRLLDRKSLYEVTKILTEDIDIPRVIEFIELGIFSEELKIIIFEYSKIINIIHIDSILSDTDFKSQILNIIKYKLHNDSTNSTPVIEFVTINWENKLITESIYEITLLQNLIITLLEEVYKTNFKFVKFGSIFPIRLSEDNYIIDYTGSYHLNLSLPYSKDKLILEEVEYNKNSDILINLVDNYIKTTINLNQNNLQKYNNYLYLDYFTKICTIMNLTHPDMTSNLLSEIKTKSHISDQIIKYREIQKLYSKQEFKDIFENDIINKNNIVIRYIISRKINPGDISIYYLIDGKLNPISHKKKRGLINSYNFIEFYKIINDFFDYNRDILDKQYQNNSSLFITMKNNKLDILLYTGIHINQFGKLLKLGVNYKDYYINYKKDYEEYNTIKVQENLLSLVEQIIIKTQNLNTINDYIKYLLEKHVLDKLQSNFKLIFVGKNEQFNLMYKYQKPGFHNIHHIWAIGIQWLLPLLLSCYGSCDPLSIGDNDKLTELSLRLFISGFSFVNLLDVMTYNLSFTREIFDWQSKSKLIDLVKNQFEYELEDEFGQGSEFRVDPLKGFNFGFELRVFDNFDIDLLYQLLEFLFLLADHIAYNDKEYTINPFDNSILNEETLNILKQGWNTIISQDYLDIIEGQLEIPTEEYIEERTAYSVVNGIYTWLQYKYIENGKGKGTYSQYLISRDAGILKFPNINRMSWRHTFNNLIWKPIPKTEIRLKIESVIIECGDNHTKMTELLMNKLGRDYYSDIEDIIYSLIDLGEI